MNPRRIAKKMWTRAVTPRVIKRVKRRGLTYLDEPALCDLTRQIRRLDRSGIAGVVIEAGCALGGSAVVMATSKARTRPLHIYDVFEMIPPPSPQDGPDVHARYATIRNGEARGIGTDAYYGYQDDLLSAVHDTFLEFGLDPEEHNVEFHRGLFSDTLFPDDEVALAHIDADWYQSVMTCLERIEPRLVPGGLFVIDDYYTWSGCKTAVDEFFKGKDAFTFETRSRLHITKKW